MLLPAFLSEWEDTQQEPSPQPFAHFLAKYSNQGIYFFHEPLESSGHSDILQTLFPPGHNVEGHFL